MPVMRTVLRSDGRRMPRPADSAGAQPAPVLRTVRGTRSIRAAAAGAVVAAGLVFSGCAGPPAPVPDPAPTLPAGVTVELAQLRADVGPRQAQVRVTNGSDTAIAVGEVRVEDPRLAGPATRVVADRTSTIPAGGSVDIRVQLPPVACPAADEGEGTVALEIVSDSRTAEATASAPDALGFLERLHARECLMERVMDAATLSFTGFEPSPPGQPAALALTVTPTGRGAVTVVGVEGTNLLSFAGVPPEEDLYSLDLDIAAAKTDPIVLELPLAPFRCDPHAVLEDKRGTIFDVRVRLDGEPGEFELFVGEEMRARILTWVGDWCRFGS